MTCFREQMPAAPPSGPRRGIGLLAGGPTLPAERLLAAAHGAERHRLGQLWVPEDYFFTGAIAAATMALATTDVPRIGIGIMSVRVRNPAVLAMELATMARAFPGRLVAGIGLGEPAWLKQMGLDTGRRVSAVRDTVIVLRRLLSGEAASMQADGFVLRNVQLAHAAAVPLYVGARGPRMLEMAGSVADGAILGWPCGPAYVADAAARIESAWSAADRAGSADIPCFTLCSVDKTARTARRRIRPTLAWALSNIGPSPVTDALGVSEQLEDMIRRGGRATIEREMPDQWIMDLSVTGEPDEAAEQIGHLLNAGASSVILYPPDSESIEHTLQMITSTRLIETALEAGVND